MKLSIIIVNYNVRYFLEQALKSIYSSRCSYSYEVYVVDNASSDDSLEMLADKFPQVHVIANSENLGFSKANNLAMRRAEGKYFLLLNPDTILREDTLQLSLDYMEGHDQCGGLGIRMIDGSGKFLPESKRGIPTPLAAFFRMSGIAKLFPHSAFFNAYHQGHLPEGESHKVEILAGAYMMLRKSVLDKIGLLDEDFFMYGEDIDLSYRIIQAGYYNYYLADSEIIHFKGESTRKASFNYVKLFHKAMIQFAQKHFNRLGGLYVIFLRLGIYVKALTSLIGGWLDRFLMPIIDFALLWLAGIGIVEVWEASYYGIEDFYTDTFTTYILPLSILVLQGSMYLFGTYDKPFRLRKLLRGTLVGMLAVLAFYGLLGEDLRSSRAVISFLAISSLGILLLIRAVRNLWLHQRFLLDYRSDMRYIIVGAEDKIGPIQDILGKQRQEHIYIGRVGKNDGDSPVLGSIADIKPIVHSHNITEIFFCTSDISRKAIMKTMAEQDRRVKYRLVEDSEFNILGSDSKNLQGKLFTRRVSYKIELPENRRAKRLYDICSSLVFFLVFPLSFFLLENKGGYLQHLFQVLTGNKTWVSYTYKPTILPELKPGILDTEDVYENALMGEHQACDQLYARDYSVWLDVSTVFKNFKKLGNAR